MLTYDLSGSSRKPLYERLYKYIRTDILDGVLAEGERLPSKRSLAEHLHISITTVENAYLHLLEEGFIYSRPSNGYFVARGINRLKAADDPSSAADLKKESEEDENYDMDFRGNLCSLKLFPVSTWTKLMRKVLSDVNITMLQTVPWNGLYELREAICDYLRRYRGIFASPDRMIIGAGTEYLYSRLLHLLGNTAVLGFEDPGYKKLAKIAAKAGMMQRFISVDQHGLTVENLRSSLANVIHLSPANHFPTGAVMSRERREQLIEWCREDRMHFIIEDDYDSEFTYHSSNLKTLYSMDENDRVIYINTFSKSLVPSIRISYMILPKSLYQLYRQSQDFYSCTVSSFEQMTLAHFISEGYFERHLNRLQNYYRKKRDLVYEAINRSPLRQIFLPEQSQAGTHLLIRVRTSMTDEEIRKKADSMHVHLSMLSDYCQFPRVSDLNTLIINYAGMETQDIDHAIELLEQLFYDDL